jgi:hypothetical protein
VPPLGGTSRLPALDGDLPRKGRPPLDLEDALRRTVDQTPPLTGQAGDRTPRGARPGRPLTVLRRLLDRPRRNWLSPPAPARLIRPFREERIGGGPPCRQVGQLSWDFVPCRRGSEVRARSSAGLFALRVSPTSASPRARHPVTGRPSTPSSSPTTCAVKDAPTARAVRGTDSHSPEPDRLSPTGVSFESYRFGNRAR